tara:strand:- start:7901 stop:8611 length:711 start_codon:yes stop_codon:yes gene_type:complete
MFIPDYLGNGVWTLPLINREHYKIQKVIESENDEMPIKNLPWIELDIGYSWQTWEKEIKNLETLNFFNVHKNEYSQGWKSLTLYDGEWNQTVTENCFAMTTWFKEIFSTKCNVGPNQKIEIMALETQGYIELHKNKETDKHNFNVVKFMFDKPQYYNVAMFNPNPMDKTKLKDKDYIGKIPCQPGKALLLDSGNYFTARNLSEQTVYYVVAQINTFDPKNEEIKETIGNIKTHARI